MLRSLLLSAPLVALVACASDPAPVANAPSVPVTSSSTAESIPVRAATTRGGNGACDATNAYVADGKVPASWTRSGRVVLTIVGSTVTAEEADDASGKQVAHDTQRVELEGSLTSFPAPWICKVGAVARVDQAATTSETDLGKAGGGKLVFEVFTPAQEDEAADLATMCHEPTGLTPDVPALQRFAAMHFATQWLTSRRYRALAHATDVQIAAAGTKSARDAAAAAAGARVDAATKAAGTDTCFYASVLRAVASGT